VVANKDIRKVMISCKILFLQAKAIFSAFIFIFFSWAEPIRTFTLFKFNPSPEQPSLSSPQPSASGFL